MIWEVARYSKEGGPPPKLLEIGFDWVTFGTPYYSGGMMEQPAGLMKKIRVLLNIHKYLEQYLNSIKRGNSNKWIAENPTMWSVVNEVLTLEQPSKDN